MGCAGKLIDDGSPSRSSRSPPLPEEGWLTDSDEEHQEQGGRGRGPTPRRADETQPSAGKHSSSFVVLLNCVNDAPDVGESA